MNITKKIFLTAFIMIGGFQSIIFAQSCNFNGLSMNNGQTTTGYNYSNVNYGLSYNCNTLGSGYEIFQCQNGYLTGLNGGHYSQYPYLNCSNNAPLDCIAGSIFGQKITIPHYNAISYPPITDVGVFVFPLYKMDLVNNSITCTMPSDYLSLDPSSNGTFAYCKNGVLYNIYGPSLLDTTAYKHTICGNRAPRDCQLGNTIILHDQSITTFNREDSRIGGSCISEVRTCTDGTLSGSLPFLTCRAYNGSCGISNSNYFDNQPLNNLCLGGTAGPLSYNSTNKQWTRSCLGDGGTDSNCLAYRTGNVSRGVCNSFPDGASFLSSTNGGLCTIGIAYNFQSSSYGWTRQCTNSIGSSNTCEARKASFPEGRIAYSTTSPTNNNVTAYLLDLQPYGAIIQNNDGNTTKIFQKNGIFTFTLQFNNKISYLTAEVNWINTRPITLADLSYDYQTKKCKENGNITLPISAAYNLLDMQTMINTCMLRGTNTSGKISIKKNKILTRKEFIESLYYFTTTIRKYNDIPLTRNEQITYKKLPNTPNIKNIVGWFTTIGGRNHIQHKIIRKSLETNRNGYITPKEIHETIAALLDSHEDSSSHREALWIEYNLDKKKTVSYASYASLMRRLLEAYDRIPIGINDSLMYTIYQKIKDQTIENQKASISQLSLALKRLTPEQAEKQGISIQRMLDDLSAVYNNTIPTRKGVITVSLEKIKQRIGGTTTNSTYKMNVLDMNTDSFFKTMSF